MRRQHGSWTAITPRTADRVILVLSLTHCEVSIDDTNRIVVTKFSDGKECLATRQDSDENRREAEDEGYEPTADGVWQCLVTHEVCHSLVSEWLWQKPSPTLRHVAGGERCEYGKQLYEEALTIAFQRFLNTQHIWPALGQYAEQLTRWRARYQRTMERLREAA
jgi:hypothetical protein